MQQFCQEGQTREHIDERRRMEHEGERLRAANAGTKVEGNEYQKWTMRWARAVL